MATASRVVAADVGVAIASRPASIALTGAPIVGIVIIGVSVVAAVAAMATRRRRRVPAASWRPLVGHGLVKDCI